MYKAIREIGEYKVGDEVPTDKALVWIKQYTVPHIEEVNGESVKKVDKVEKSDSNDDMLDDYLARGINVVKNNLSKDSISQHTLGKLLKLEKSGKNRKPILNIIKRRLNN